MEAEENKRFLTDETESNAIQVIPRVQMNNIEIQFTSRLDSSIHFLHRIEAIASNWF